MTNRLALILAFVILAAVAVDVWYVGDAHLVFLSRKLLDLIEWMAFWR